MRIATFVLTALIAASSALSGFAQEAPKKKLIELGWDIPTTEYIRKHWQEMEKNAPFDGIMYDLVATAPDGKRVASQELFTREPWKREWFKTCVDDLNACQFKRYRNNFIRMNFHPAPFDWADDEAWSNLCEKAAICAWVARETNGDLSFDFESYGAAMFRHDHSTGRSFEESAALARKRGAEMCAAIVKEYPDVVILCLWMNSINFGAGRSPNPDAVLAGASYGLLPSFINGLLDAAAPETVFVDGCENGYYMNGDAEYARAALNMILATGPAVRLVAPENRKKYRAQTQVGFGYYLDMYSNPEGSNYYRGPEPGETRFDRFAANLRAAWNAADEYVWIYGEQKRWWAPENAASDDDWTSWEEALPGITDFLFELTDPEGANLAAKERTLNNPNRENLIKNGDFAKIAENGQPDGWGTWQIETHPTGKFTSKDGAALLKGMTNGCYIQSISVNPGERYFVMAKTAFEKNSRSQIRVRWQDANGRWVAEADDVMIVPDVNSAPDEDVEIFGVAVVPPSAYRLVVLLSASGDGKSDATFDNAQVYRVAPVKQ